MSKRLAGDEAMQQLHDKATRRIPLSADETAQLEAWYAQQDRAEDELLDAAPRPEDVEVLQAQLNAALAQLHVVVQRIEELTAENEAARREIATLQHQLLQTRPVQRA